jgi:hypothetical protein
MEFFSMILIYVQCKKLRMDSIEVNIIIIPICLPNPGWDPTGVAGQPSYRIVRIVLGIFYYLYVDSLTYSFGWSTFLCRIRFCDTLIVIFF